MPIAEMMFVYVATLYGGSISLTTPMLWALSFIATFLIGGVTGIFLHHLRLLGPDPANWTTHPLGGP